MPNSTTTAPAPPALSFTASSCLMQDALPGDLLPARRGADVPNQLAPFPNPFHGGKEEMVFIGIDGRLHHLFRDDDTGWKQAVIKDTDGNTHAAAEVVTIVSDIDRGILAVFVDEAGTVGCLRLIKPTPEEPAGWGRLFVVPEPSWDAPLPKIRKLSVDYYANKAAVYGITSDGNVHRFEAGLRSGGHRLFWRTAITGRISFPIPGHTPQAIGGLSAFGSRAAFVFYPTDKTVFFGDGKNTPRRINTTAIGLVGVFRSQQEGEVGAICLAAGGGIEVTWGEPTAKDWGQQRIPNLGFTRATLWTDADGLLHIYGRDKDNALQVLHQVSWGADHGPEWAKAKVETKPGEPPQTTTACIAIHPKVIDFAIDPYPDYTPNQILARSHVSEQDRYVFCAQDMISARWSTEAVRLPADKDKYPNIVNHYVTDVTLVGAAGASTGGRTVAVTASTLVEIACGGTSYLVGPGHSEALALDAAGRLSISMPAVSLLPPTLQITALGTEVNISVQPAADLHNYLTGTGTLASQSGQFDKTALLEARDGKGHKIAPGLDESSAETVVQNISRALAAGRGEPVHSWMYSGDGPAPLLHGFGLCKESDGRLTSFNFDTQAEYEAHLHEMRSAPNYGGILDDFFALIGDCWEGIRNGAIAVTRAIVGVGSKILHVVIEIAGKAVELVQTLIEGVESAVHAVEAVFRMAVESVAKVVDWLKALFAFKDIWATKEAVESGLTTLVDYAAHTVTHYGDTLHGFFQQQKKDLPALFADMRKQVGDKRAGDAPNVAPAMHDAAGGGVDKHVLQGNPQANWLLNRVSASNQGGGSALELAAPPDSPIVQAFIDFIADVTTSGLDALFTPLADAITALIKPGDPNAVGSSGLVAMIDLLEKATGGLLDMADTLVQHLVRLLKVVGDNVIAALTHTTDSGLINTLYRWIQSEAEVSPDKITNVSPLGLCSLILAFFVTTIHKLINGVHSVPFPDKFPAITPPPWHTAHDVRQAGPDPKAMIGLQIAASALAVGGAVCETFVDLDYSRGLVAKVSPVQAAASALGAAVGGTGFGGMVMSCPSVIGLEWDDKSAATGVFATESFLFLLQLANIVSFAVTSQLPGVPVVDSPALKSGFRVLGSEQPYAQALSSALNVISLGFSCAAVARGAWPPYQFLANFFRAAPETLPLIRGRVSPLNPSYLAFETRCFVYAAITGLLGTASGVMGMAAAIAELANPPRIRAGQQFRARAKQGFRAKVDVIGADQLWNYPAKDWALSNIPGGVPVSIDKDGYISGTIDTAGTYPMTVSCTDSYGPALSAAPTVITVLVTP